MSNTWSCTKCGTTNSNGTYRCKECKNERPGTNTWTCLRCGTTNSNGTYRCKECKNERPR